LTAVTRKVLELVVEVVEAVNVLGFVQEGIVGARSMMTGVIPVLVLAITPLVMGAV
jgi:hypothetical protein